MRDESKVKQTNKAKQHSTPKAVTFPKKNELPRVGHVHVHVLIEMLITTHVSLVSVVSVGTPRPSPISVMLLWSTRQEKWNTELGEGWSETSMITMR